MRTLSSLLVIVAACASSRPPPSTPPQQQATIVEWEVHGQDGPPGAEPGGAPNAAGAPSAGGAPSAATAPTTAAAPATLAGRSLPQPPDVKLKLGHFTSAKHNIGLVIDRTRKEARLRFDHTQDVLHLDPMRSRDRIDYIRTINQVVLQAWDNGRMVVFVPGASESIEVVRDGDAEPL
jgi:hypothetical protein